MAEPGIDADDHPSTWQPVLYLKIGVLLLVLLAVGLIVGVLVSQLYRHRRRTQLAKKAGKAGDPGGAVVGRDEAERKPG